MTDRTPANMAIWNALGLAPHNGALIITVASFDLALNLAREQVASGPFVYKAFYAQVPGQELTYPDAMAIRIPQLEAEGWRFVGFVNDCNFMMRRPA